jgi:hypothetical protein
LDRLEAGIRIVSAPRFHNDRAPSDRLRVNSGSLAENGRFLARDDWRRPSVDELANLHAEQTGAFPEGDLALFAITEPLRAKWWTLAEASFGSAQNDWFTGFANELAEFARFKGLPLPTTCTFDALVNDVGPDVLPLGGLAFNLDPATPYPVVEPTPRLLGGINLGNEPTALVFLNLTADRMGSHLQSLGERTATLSDLASGFLGRFPRYPLVRVTLWPGDGFWLPRGAVVFDGDTRGKECLDVMLMIRG